MVLPDSWLILSGIHLQIPYFAAQWQASGPHTLPLRGLLHTDQVLWIARHCGLHYDLLVGSIALSIVSACVNEYSTRASRFYVGDVTVDKEWEYKGSKLQHIRNAHNVKSDL